MNNAISILNENEYCTKLRLEIFNLRQRLYSKDQNELFGKEQMLQDFMNNYYFVLNENKILKEENEKYKNYLLECDRSLDDKINAFNKLTRGTLSTFEIEGVTQCKAVFCSIVDLCTKYMRDSINLRKKNIRNKNKINELQKYISDLDRNEVKKLFVKVNESKNIFLKTNMSQNQNCECNQLKVMLDRLSEDFINLSVQYQKELLNHVDKETEVEKLYEQITGKNDLEHREEQRRLNNLIGASFERWESVFLNNSAYQHEENSTENIHFVNKYINCKKVFKTTVSKLSNIIGNLIEICKFDDSEEDSKCIELSKEIENSNNDPEVLLKVLNDLIILKRKYKTNDKNIYGIFQNSNINSTLFCTFINFVQDLLKEIKVINEDGMRVKNESNTEFFINNEQSILNKSINFNSLFQKIEELSDAIHDLRSSAGVMELILNKSDTDHSPNSLSPDNISWGYEHKKFDSVDCGTDFKNNNLIKLCSEEKRTFEMEIEKLKELLTVKDKDIVELVMEKIDSLKASFNFTTRIDKLIKCFEENKSRLNEINMLNNTVKKLQDANNKLNNHFKETKSELIKNNNSLLDQIEKLNFEKDDYEEELRKATICLRNLNKTLLICLERNTEYTKHFFDVYVHFCSKVYLNEINYDCEDINIEKLKENFIEEINKRYDADNRSNSNKENIPDNCSTMTHLNISCKTNNQLKEIIKEKEEIIEKLKEKLLEHQKLIPCIGDKIGCFKEINELDGYLQKAVRHVPQSIKQSQYNFSET